MSLFKLPLAGVIASWFSVRHLILRFYLPYFLPENILAVIIPTKW